MKSYIPSVKDQNVDSRGVEGEGRNTEEVRRAYDRGQSRMGPLNLRKNQATYHRSSSSKYDIHTGAHDDPRNNLPVSRVLSASGRSKSPKYGEGRRDNGVKNRVRVKLREVVAQRSFPRGDSSQAEAARPSRGFCW